MINDTIKLTFLGGAETVTGSKILLETHQHTILIDCGMFQGLKSLRLKNWEAFSIDPGKIDAIILTHAHLDHCGYIPVLAKNGFKGEIHCTIPTKDLTELILKDSAKIQEEDAEAANKYHYSKHNPAKPLYTVEDVENVLRYFVSHEKNQWIVINDEIKICYRHAGHILGAAFIEMKCLNKKIVFSGDIGRKNPLILYPPDKPTEANYLVTESTYGDRLHAVVNTENELAEIITKTYKRGGIVMIPSFAIGRTQELLYLINILKEKQKIADVPIYLDSPMGIKATEIMLKYPDWHKLSDGQIHKIASQTNTIKDFKQTIELVKDKSPKIVIAGSGMITGGRILYYLEHLIDNEKNTVLLVGHQSEGTRGRLLYDGAHEIKFHGKYFPIKAQVCSMSSLSGHADQSELIDWLSKIEGKMTKVFINHGEAQSAGTLKTKITDQYGWDCEVAKMNHPYIFNL